MRQRRAGGTNRSRTGPKPTLGRRRRAAAHEPSVGTFFGRRRRPRPPRPGTHGVGTPRLPRAYTSAESPGGRRLGCKVLPP
ncbi:hypothetical protein IscW_ISCW021066 [Ixodes scapularis]|uniref:Uncharacterized protein n=1 Tax=Ixodes scapularis TaxID=6945 RepID=B7Q9X9_IXOSC|nr:hypothetical protein IscW_ISCW021066 [Ixodes scapularis]|eukprot:XP_002406401.1 hypothetical protein IscW_ISCW021066 [Ixodes scapularis]